MDALPGFQQVAPVPAETIDAYHGRLPDEILNIWNTQGYGTAVNGFIKVIDPGRYVELLEGCLPRPGMIPVLATGMADVLVWENAKLRLLQFRYNKVQGFGSSLKHFFRFLSEDVFLEEDLEWQPYPAAVEKYGQPAFDECFGYVPLLVLGGPERVENLEKVRIFEHIQIITQLGGPIDY